MRFAHARDSIVKLCLVSCSKWLQTRSLTRNMLIKNPRLVFVPKYNGSLVYNADIEWKNGAIPAREVMKFRPKAQASRTSPSVYSGIWIVIIELTASILS